MRGHTWLIMVAFLSLSKHGEIVCFLSVVCMKIEAELDIVSH